MERQGIACPGDLDRWVGHGVVVLRDKRRHRMNRGRLGRAEDRMRCRVVIESKQRSLSEEGPSRLLSAEYLQ